MAQPETVAAFEDSITKLERAGANVRELTLPALFAELTGARERISDYERARGLAHEWQHHREQISERLRRCMERGFALAPEAYWSAQELAQRCRLLFSEAMGGIDALLVPCVPGEAPKGLDYGGDPKMQELWTLLGTPSMTLPTHRGPERPAGGYSARSRVRHRGHAFPDSALGLASPALRARRMEMTSEQVIPTFLYESQAAT